MRTLSAAEVENVEAELMYQAVTTAPAADRELLDMEGYRLAGGVVLAVRRDPTSYWSKALGFGFEEPVGGPLIDNVLDVWRAAGNPVGVLQIAPEVLPGDWAEICRDRGITPGCRIAKLAAPIDEVRTTGSSDLRVAPVGTEDADRWARVVLSALGMPYEGLPGMFGAMVTHPQFHPYGLWDGDDIVGGGTLFVHGQIGAMLAGAVHEDYRNRGGQTALIAARVGRARELGCRWVSTETGQPAEGETNSSMSNMLRAGLKPLYVRRNHVWRAA